MWFCVRARARACVRARVAMPAFKFQKWGFLFSSVFVVFALLSNVLCFLRFRDYCEALPLDLRLSAGPASPVTSHASGGSGGWRACVDVFNSGGRPRLVIFLIYVIFFLLQLLLLWKLRAALVRGRGVGKAGGTRASVYTEGVLKYLDGFLALAAAHFLFELVGWFFMVVGGPFAYETMFVYHTWLVDQPLGKLQSGVDAVLLSFSVSYFSLRVALENRRA